MEEYQKYNVVNYINVKYWYKFGTKIFHREDGPAVEYTNDCEQWYFNGKLHREDGPAVECSNGYREWWLNGKLHRIGGPAIEGCNVYKQWYLNGKRHREDGPAVETTDGNNEYWINGFKISKRDIKLKKDSKEILLKNKIKTLKNKYLESRIA